ncbi:MAG: MFS transporter [Candidatus Nezhaarchaeales archaeon]
MGELRYRWIMLGLAFFTAFTLHLYVFSHGPVIPYVILEMGLTHTQAGSLFSMCILTLALTRIGWGPLLDRFTLKAIMGLMATLIGVFNLLRSYAWNYETLLVIQLALGAALGSIMPCLPKLVATCFPRKEESLATGLYMTGFASGGMVGLGLTAWLLDWTGSWRTTLSVYSLCSLLLAVAWLTVKQPGEGRRRDIKLRMSVMKDFTTIIKMRKVWVLTGLFLCSGGCYDTASFWLPYILQLKGTPHTVIGPLSLLLPLGFLVAGPIVGILSDRVGKRRLIMAILGLICGLMVLLIGVTVGLTLYVAIFLVGFCSIGVLTLVLAIPTRLEEGRITASVVGLMSSVGNIGTIAMPVLMGYVKDVTGSFLPALALLALMAEGMFILSVLVYDASS